MNSRTKKITTIGMFSALAFVCLLVIRIPMVLFLKYEPKDVVIVIAGFIYGPLTSLLISFIVSFIEMLTISDTGIIGFIMNILSTAAFACTAAYIYKKNRTIKGAVFGLIMGVIAMSLVMLMWNYLITPSYMGLPRSEVVPLLWSAILPFNLIKGGLNAGLTLLLYKPVVTVLRKISLVDQRESSSGKINLGVILFALVILATCVLFVLSIYGII